MAYIDFLIFVVFDIFIPFASVRSWAVTRNGRKYITREINRNFIRANFFATVSCNKKLLHVLSSEKYALSNGFNNLPAK